MTKAILKIAGSFVVAACILAAAPARSQVPPSLLTGMTPDTLQVPSGWTLVAGNNFEAGIPATEFICAECVITTTRPHTRTYSVEGTYGGSGAQVRWGVLEGHPLLTDFTEVYLSYWEYTEAQARFNDEYYIARLSVNSPVFQEIVIDYFSSIEGAFNSTLARPVASSQGSFSDAKYWPTNVAVPVGVWTQVEVWYKKNTPGQSDGFVRFYLNGAAVGGVEIVGNLNGSETMAGIVVEAGGDYSKATWRAGGLGLCGPAPCDACFIGDGTDSGPLIFNFSVTCAQNGDPVLGPGCNNQCPPSGFVPIFKRFIDDVIVIKR